MSDAPQPAENTADNSRREMHGLIVQSKVYHFMAMMFALLGFIVFAYLYYDFTKGDVMKVIEAPFSVLVMFIPFLPAVVLSMKAKKAQKKLEKMAPEPVAVEAPAAEPASAAKPPEAKAG